MAFSDIHEISDMFAVLEGQTFGLNISGYHQVYVGDDTKAVAQRDYRSRNLAAIRERDRGYAARPDVQESRRAYLKAYRSTPEFKARKAAQERARKARKGGRA